MSLSGSIYSLSTDAIMLLSGITGIFMGTSDYGCLCLYLSTYVLSVVMTSVNALSTEQTVFAKDLCCPHLYPSLLWLDIFLWLQCVYGELTMLLIIVKWK